jgi:hypothetical protein
MLIVTSLASALSLCLAHPIYRSSASAAREALRPDNRWGFGLIQPKDLLERIRAEKSALSPVTPSYGECVAKTGGGLFPPPWTSVRTSPKNGRYASGGRDARAPRGDRVPDYAESVGRTPGILGRAAQQLGIIPQPRTRAIIATRG